MLKRQRKLDYHGNPVVTMAAKPVSRSVNLVTMTTEPIFSNVALTTAKDHGCTAQQLFKAI